ncbi:hypothetical protein PF008_g27123 [Phytophthora fragariae]|uniref:Uncharacterized protein n=1 Tax=Phytophthora fragariae TaxID=53985 RepID=A0A6G0QF22_9STRA|nr:hypothetical protein PF008_g27123 [Phytophthora fragariae]
MRVPEVSMKAMLAEPERPSATTPTRTGPDQGKVTLSAPQEAAVKPKRATMRLSAKTEVRVPNRDGSADASVRELIE